MAESLVPEVFAGEGAGQVPVVEDGDEDGLEALFAREEGDEEAGEGGDGGWSDLSEGDDEQAVEGSASSLAIVSASAAARSTRPDRVPKSKGSAGDEKVWERCGCCKRSSKDGRAPKAAAPQLSK